MPTYVYEVLDAKGNATGEYFEIVQSMKDEALKKQPSTGKPVKRVPQAPNIAGKWSPVKANTPRRKSDRIEEKSFIGR